MSRKTGIIAIIIVVSIALLFLLWRWSERWLTVPPEPFKLIPQDAMMIAEIKDLSGFTQEIVGDNKLWDDLKFFDNIRHADTVLQNLDSILSENNTIRQVFRKNPVLISFHEIGKNKISLLGIVKIPGFVKESSLKNALSNLGISNPGEKTKWRNYNGYKIYTITRPGNALDLHYSFVHGLLTLSTSQITLESCLRQLSSSHSVIDQTGFREVMKTAGENTSGNLYIRADKLPDWLKNWLKTDVARTVENLFPVSGWSELDITLSNTSLLLNGFSAANHQYHELNSVITGESPGTIDLFNVFPSSVHSGAILYNKDKEQYQKNISSFRQTKDIRLTPDSYENICGCDPAGKMIQVLGQQAGVAYLNIANQTPLENRIAVLEVQSRNMATNTLEELLKKYAAKNNLNFTSLYRTFNADRETKIRIYQFPFTGLFAQLSGRFMGTGYSYVTFYENFLVAGKSEKTLVRFVQDNLRHYTLANDPDFGDFLDGLASRANFFFFEHLPFSEKFNSLIFHEDFMRDFHRYSGAPMKINFIGYQAIFQNNLVYNNIFIQYRDEIKKDASTVWESLLDTVTDYKPQLFVNHYTGENEIFIQDQQNSLYLLNNAGRILWKIKIPEKIMGQAYQIDYFRNGKLQIMFNTRHYLYLIDRNGNNVEHFPVLLRAQASNPMALFDYEKNRNYRIFIGGEDKKVYLYDKEGKTVQGWKIKKYESPVISPVKHFRIRSRDYIVFSDSMNLYILDRRGNTRVKVSEQIPRVKNQDIFLDDFSSSSPSLVVNGDGGLVYRITFSGKVSHLKFNDQSGYSYFIYSDLNGDRKGEYIFISGNKLEVLSGPGKRKFSYSFPSLIDKPPLIFTFAANNQKLGVVDATNHMIYLVNNNGTLYKGFPLKGNSLFTIGKFEPSGTRFNLIVGGEDNFLYNYVVK